MGLVFAALGARVLLTDLPGTQARSGPYALALAKTPCVICTAVRHACASQPWWVCQALIRRNVELNATVVAAGGGSAEAAVLAWGATDPCALPGAWSAPDLVIAADVVYHRELFQPLLATLAAFGAPRWFRD